MISTHHPMFSHVAKPCRESCSVSFPRQVSLTSADSDFCLRGAALKEAARFYRQAPGELNRLEQQFLQASQRHGRQRWGGGIAAVLVGLALVGGFAGWLQREAWLDRQLRQAVFNLPDPQTVPILLKRLPDRLHQADRARQQGKADQAIHLSHRASFRKTVWYCPSSQTAALILRRYLTVIGQYPLQPEVEIIYDDSLERNTSHHYL